MTSRRNFLSALSATLGSAVLPGTRDVGADAVTVDATATIFRAQPDGRASLVRFSAYRVDAPAGRLRVYDRARRLIGTAGMIRSGDGLYGELWFPVDREMRITTELESPGVRGVVRTAHRLRPARRWTIYWVTVADPQLLAHELDDLPPLYRTLQRAIYAASGVKANPMVEPHLFETSDHLAFLRMAGEARALNAEHGIAVSDVAVSTSESPLPATLALALAGSGVRYVVRPSARDTPLEWLQARDGSRVLIIALPPDSDPHSLGFTATRDEMTQRIERWLLAQRHPFPAADRQAGGRVIGSSGGPANRWTDGTSEAAALLLDTEPNVDTAAVYTAVQEWNARFAFPRIVQGIPQMHSSAVAGTRHTGIPVAQAIPVQQVAIPSATELASLAANHEQARMDRIKQIVAPLGSLLGTQMNGLDTVAREIATTIPGTVVFNPSPFDRTDVAVMPDGSEQVVTDVPGLGYAFVVDRGDRGHRGDSAPASLTIEGEHYRVTLDRSSGAIRSLVSRADGIEWVRRSSDGLNAVTGAILEGLSCETLPGVGARLIARRWSPGRGEVRSTVTVYDTLPWVDIENDAHAVGIRAMQYVFPFAVPYPRIAWEVPAGHEESRPPLDRIVHLRWLHLASQIGTVMFRGIDAPFASVYSDGTLASFGPKGRARYRVAVTAHHPGLAGAARFGWDAEPLVTRRVPAPGSGRLPRFGSLIELDQPAIAIIGLKPADDGDGMIVYLQELAGSGRYVSVGAALLRFKSARVVDFLERDIGEPAVPVPDGAAVRIPAWGVVALRLLDVELRGG